ncbi:hypothetical protein SAMN02745753_04128 [Marinomonas polaris DSM 16579]|jgi:hypothetical protein|uniref:Phage integrase family protein n=1 Tax=Marinomonas polaris DSM 16579 TaxID=1122206 RepID=A0A1M5KTT4_9GAMM|nr:hypothetical protein [Marinomonas polaris]SHG56272.1 hypothetical protein SAMN02745753_04128 [Marinomonas polaris DSM 16579]
MNILPLFVESADDLFNPDPVTTTNFVPAIDHVMSRGFDGHIKSVYGDPMWDYSMYVGASTRFHIERFIQEVCTEENADSYRYEFKIILFLLIYRSTARAINTIAELFNILKRHTRLAIKQRLTIRESLQDNSTLDFIVHDPKLDKKQIARRLLDANNLFSALHRISVQIEGFDIFPSNDAFKYLGELIKEYPLISQQTPVIPTRILSHRIKTCLDYIDRFIALKDCYECLMEFRHRFVRDYIAEGGSPRVARDNAAKAFAEELKKDKYSEFVEYFEIEEFQNLKGVPQKVRIPIREMIHAFSGMRKEECNSVAMDGFRFKTIGRNRIAVIRTYTTKMAKESGYFADWVTSPEIEKAFEAANIINRVTLKYEYGLDPVMVDESSVPLFLSVNTRKRANKGALFDLPIQKASFKGWLWKQHRLNRDPEIIVSHVDMAEILLIDPNASAESLKPGIEVGKHFEFQSHMYRRSLAVYAARSGLVSLPTLKAQFKHIAIQTSAFYGNDAAFAKNFILPKSSDISFDASVISQRGFIKEFQDELAEGQVERLYSEVITADEIVFGGMGSLIQKQKISGKLPTLFTDREKTKKQVKQGRLRCTETPLGNCMAVEVCDRIAFSSITTCVGCGYSVFNNRSVPLLVKTKVDYQGRLERFGTGTPYGKQLEKDIRDIETTLEMRNKLINTVDITDGRA